MLEHTLTSLIHLHYVKQTAPFERLIHLLACGGAALKITEEEDKKPLSAAGECSSTWPTHTFLGSLELVSLLFVRILVAHSNLLKLNFPVKQTGPGENSSFNTKTIWLHLLCPLLVCRSASAQLLDCTEEFSFFLSCCGDGKSYKLSVTTFTPPFLSNIFVSATPPAKELIAHGSKHLLLQKLLAQIKNNSASYPDDGFLTSISLFLTSTIQMKSFLFFYSTLPNDRRPLNLRSSSWPALVLCPLAASHGVLPSPLVTLSFPLQAFGSWDTGTVGERVLWPRPMSLKHSLTLESSSSSSQGEDRKLPLCWTQTQKSSYLPKPSWHVWL